jgi:asparagine synthetase B (glutamine-hydrolysing)
LSDFYIVEAENNEAGTSLAEAVGLMLTSLNGGHYHLFSKANYFVGFHEKKCEVAGYVKIDDSEVYVGAGRLDDERAGLTFIDGVERAQSSGKFFYERLRGHFCVAHIDLRAGVLKAASNRFGTVPMFWCEGDGVFLLAPDIMACLLTPGMDREFDPVALGEGFLFDNIFLDRTPFASIRHLASGTVMTRRRGKTPYVKKYWHAKLWGNAPAAPDDLVRQGAFLCKEAVRAALGNANSAAILLSGGLDSRVILGAIRGTKDIDAWSYGAPGCWDLSAGKKLAAIAGARHEAVTLRAHHYIEMSERMVALSGGMSHAGHTHMGAVGRRFAVPERVVLTGLIGGPIFGCFSRQEKNSGVAADDEIDRYMAAEACLTRAELALVCEGDVWGEIHKDLRLLMDECLENNSPVDLPEYIGLTQRQSSLLIFSEQLLGLCHDVRLPYAHYGLAEFCLSLPPEWRFQRKLEQLLIEKSFPDLAGVSIPEMAAPPYSSVQRERWGRAKIKVRRLMQVGTELASHGKYSPANPLQKERQSALLRQDLKPWLHEQLELLTQRGLLTPDASIYFKRPFLRGRYDLPRFRLIALQQLCHLAENVPALSVSRIAPWMNQWRIEDSGGSTRMKGLQ